MSIQENLLVVVGAADAGILAHVHAAPTDKGRRKPVIPLPKPG